MAATINSGSAKSSGGTNSSAMPTPALKPIPLGPGATIQKYNKIPHLVDLYLENSGMFGGTQIFQINPAAVINMVIEKNFVDWVVGGELTFLFMFEEPEDTETGRKRGTTAMNGKGEKAAAAKGFSFRADGFDLLRVMIRNVKPEGEYENGEVIDTDGEKDTRWTLSYLFSIVDVEDVENLKELKGQMGAPLKCLKIKFQDVRQQILKSSNLQYSTAQSSQAIEDPQLFNKKVLFTGDALFEIFNKALTNTEAGGDPGYGIILDQTKWDKGLGKIFYTSPANWSAADDIDYVLGNHVGSEPLQTTVPTTGQPKPQLGDLCVLRTIRPQKPEYLEEICLTPLTKIFKQARELQYEHFFVQGTNYNPGDLKAPIGEVITAEHGQIISYSFVDMSGGFNTELFHSTPVCSTNIRDRSFSVEFNNNSIVTARQCIVDNYMKALYKKGEGVELFAPQLHKSKLRNNVFPTFTLNADNQIARQKNGLHQLLYTGLFHNLCICFRTLGLTLREPGTFIGIDQTQGSGDSDHSNKLFGQWFVVQVKHIIEAGAYMNEIYAIKLHRFQTPSEPFTETIDTAQQTT